MNYSGYQIESVLRQLRRLRGMLLAAPPPAGQDPVHLSEEGRQQAGTVRLLSRGEPPRTVRGLYDHRSYPPVIERELERRAESFLGIAEPDPDEDE